MAVLSAADRAQVTQDIQRSVDCPAGLTKAQLRAAVDAADQWAEDNSAAYNTALPVAARNALTSRQKATLLMFVIDRRQVVS